MIAFHTSNPVISPLSLRNNFNSFHFRHKCTNKNYESSPPLHPLSVGSSSRRKLLTIIMNEQSITTLEGCKRNLIETVSDLDFGRVSINDEKKKEQIEQLVNRLAEMNPTVDPAKSDLLNGQWNLLYTDSDMTLAMSRPKFLYASRIVQKIDAQKEELINEESGEIKALNGLFKIPWKNVIYGECKPSTSKFSNDQYIRLKVLFKAFMLGGVFRIKFPGSAVGWQDHLYLGNDLRIVRTNKNNIVVMERG